MVPRLNVYGPMGASSSGTAGLPYRQRFTLLVFPMKAGQVRTTVACGTPPFPTRLAVFPPCRRPTVVTPYAPFRSASLRHA
jgi:hypothetical protein